MRPQIVLFGDSITQHSFGSGGWGAAITNAYSRKADVVLRGYSGYNTRWALFLLNHIFPLLAYYMQFLENFWGGNLTEIIPNEETRTAVPLLFSQKPKGLEKPPIAVTLFFGANDAALLEGTGKRQHVPVEEYKTNLRKMVEHIKCLSSKTLIVLITPPPIDMEGRREFARFRYGDKASNTPDRTNGTTGIYAKQCVALAEELGLPSINLWSKMQETDGWQKKFLSDGLHLTSEGNNVVFEEVVKIFDGAGFSDLAYDFPAHSDIDEDDPGKSFVQHFYAV